MKPTFNIVTFIGVLHFRHVTLNELQTRTVCNKTSNLPLRDVRSVLNICYKMIQYIYPRYIALINPKLSSTCKMSSQISYKFPKTLIFKLEKCRTCICGQRCFYCRLIHDYQIQENHNYVL